MGGVAAAKREPPRGTRDQKERPVGARVADSPAHESQRTQAYAAEI